MTLTLFPTTFAQAKNARTPEGATYELVVVDYGEDDYSSEKALDTIVTAVNDESDYCIYLVKTNEDGTKTNVDTSNYEFTCEATSGSQNALVTTGRLDACYVLRASGIKEAKENLTLTATLNDSSESITRTVPFEVNDVKPYPDFSLAVYGIEFNYMPERAVSSLDSEMPYQVSLVRTKADGTYSVVDTDLYTLEMHFTKGDKTTPIELTDLGYSYPLPNIGKDESDIPDSFSVHAEGLFGSADLTLPIKGKEVSTSSWEFTCEAVKFDSRYRGTGSLWITTKNTGATQNDLNGMKLYVYDENDRDLSDGGWDIHKCIGTEGNGYTLQPAQTDEWNWLFDDDQQSKVEGEAIPYKVVICDADGNEVYTKEVWMTYAPEGSTYECMITKKSAFGASPVKSLDVIVGQKIDYNISLYRTAPDGTSEYVSPKSMILDWNTTIVYQEFMDLDFAYNSQKDMITLSITGKKVPTGPGYPKGCDFFFCFPSLDPAKQDIFYGNNEEVSYDFNYIDAQNIDLDTEYTISNKKGETLFYTYQPTDTTNDGIRHYTLWLDGVDEKDASIGIFAGDASHSVFSRNGNDPVYLELTPTKDNARFELVESKGVKNIEFLSVPESMIQDIRENGVNANLNGFKFKVTYDDGSTRIYDYEGTKGSNSNVFHMDWTPDGNIYDCSYSPEENIISLFAFRMPDSPTIGEFEIPNESKVIIKEGLTEVTGNLGETEFNTVVKITNKLTDTIVSNEGYTDDNTLVYDIEFVISEDGKTWVPVTAENFPKEGIVVTLPYPEGTNAADFDFMVVHMFDEDVNGHKAGEVETPEVIKGEDGISFRLMGTSPVMIGYKNHVHVYGEWTDCQDGKNHQRTCTCGDVQIEAHAWDNGKITTEATKDHEGIKTYTCEICGATRTESMPKLASDTTTTNTGDMANLALWMAAMFVSMVGLSGTYLVRRKTKYHH